MKLKVVAASIAVIGASSIAMAQSSDNTTARVEVTGSSIKRVADQNALPIDVLSRSDIERLGISTAEGLVNQLAANAAGATNATSTNTVFGADQDRLTGAGDFANLRGLGSTGTLVLLNGRRMATHGMSGSSVDLNSIPMEAIERVETLKDGASAIYGTDAIGGVINFITKRNFEGVAVNASYSMPQASGGGQRTKVSATVGHGNLQKDKFNVMASISWEDENILRGIDRPWATGFQPDRFLTPDSTSAQHANIIGSAGTALPTSGSVVGASDPTKYTNLNLLAIQNQCDGLNPYTVPLAPNINIWDKFGYTKANATYRCTRDYGRMYMLSAPKDALNLLVKGTFDLQGHTASLELVGSRSDRAGEYAPFQFSTSSNAITNYPVNGPYYKDLKALVGAAQFDPTKPIAYRLNMIDWGFRENTQTSDNLRLTASLEGALAKYDYNVGFSYGEAEASTLLRNGYADTKKLIAFLQSGIYNPFLMPGETQSAAAMAGIEDMQVRGRIQGGKTSVAQADATLSGELGKFLGGSIDFAVGINSRHETYEFSGTQTFNCVSTFTAANAALSNSTMGCPGNTASPKLSRDINAVFGELLVRPMKNLELTLQVRHDDYQEIGGTTNPKIAFKYTPIESLLLRGSANTGFRAPTPQQVQLGRTELALTGQFRDPELCANPASPIDASQCSRSSVPYFTGGNLSLKPEESKQASAGFVFAPTRSLQGSVDYWQVELTDRIRTLSVTGDLIPNYTLFRDNFVRDPATGIIEYIQAGWVNAADSKTKGIDFGVTYNTKVYDGKLRTSLSGTKMLSHKERLIPTAAYKEYVGKWSNTTLYLPWRLTASLGYAYSNWDHTLSASYRDSYEDEDRTPYTAVSPTTRTVSSYTTFNLVSSYTGVKNVSLTAGILNLLDKDPPFTWHNADNVIGAGWDPRIADPRGRTFTLSASYNFR